MLAGRPTSVWNDSVPITDHPQLSGEVEVDVAVVGAGIVGVTTALLLKLSGKRVALLEARRVGRQVTGHSNAKITSLHSLIYADLMARLGEEAAGLYGEANQAAIRRIADWVEKREIDCGFERRPAYTFTQRPDRVAEIEAEYEAAIQLGLPASLHRDIGLPYPVQAAIRFDDQAQFNPTAYVRDLAASVPGDQSLVFERTRALEIEAGDPCEFRTESGTRPSSRRTALPGVRPDVQSVTFERIPHDLVGDLVHAHLRDARLGEFERLLPASWGGASRPPSGVPVGRPERG